MPDGALPNGWNGAEQLLVSSVDRGRALHTSTDRNVGDLTVTTNPIPFPSNFRIDLLVSGSRCAGSFALGAGPIVFRSNCDGMSLQNQGFQNADLKEYTSVRIDKVDDVLRAFVNGNKEFEERVTGMATPDNIVLVLAGEKGAMIVHRISVSALETSSSKDLRSGVRP